MLTALLFALFIVCLLPNRLMANPLHAPINPSGIDRLRQNLAPVLTLSDEEIIRLIPERAGLYFVACPNCDGGAQEGQIAWDIAHPEAVYCKYCNLRYPNDQYPDDKVLRVANLRGEIHEYPYWEDATGYRIFFRAKGWYLAREYFARAGHDLARLYAATQQSEYARRAGLILNRFAEVYPGYCVHYDYPFKQKILFPGDQTFPYPVPDYRAAKWSWWAYMDIPENLILTYDLIKNSGALSSEQQTRIERDFFRASVDFVRSYPPALTNMDPTMLRALITAGRVLPDPEYIHDAVRRIGLLVERQFFADGVWREGAVSYHNQTINGLDILIRQLKGYTDPQGYAHPESGRFDNLDLTERFPILQKAARIPEYLRYPNGRVVAFHDTWAREQREPAPASSPLLLPFFGHARLGRGEGENQLQAHLHFSGGYGHQHADLLSLTLFSHGRERLSDIGYTHTRHRAWTIGTLSHNTVAVDGKDQHMGSERQPTDGNLLLYAPVNADFQAIEASADRAYPGLTTTYRRLLILVGISPANAYLIDVFRVAGGSRHEYLLIGDADSDGVLTTDQTAAPYGPTLLPPGVEARLPTGESVPGDAQGHNLGYAYIRNVEQARLSRTWTARFTSADAPAGTVRIHSLTDPGGAIFTAHAPSIRRARENDALLDSITMPMLVHRREGASLKSNFAHVIEPHTEYPVLARVERLPASDPDAIALKIAHGDAVDYILISGDPIRAFTAGNLTLAGRIGFIRQRNGITERMTLVGGARLSLAAETLTGHGILSAGITGVHRKATGHADDAFLLDIPLPDRIDVRGLTAIMRDGAGFTRGYEIAGYRDRMLILKDDPGFDILPDGTCRHAFFPGRTWTGANRIEIATINQQ